LTAYAQLSALKLDCQRSFISLIDHETQYIIAEATRTVSLETGETDAGADDAIYLGATALDIFWGVCPQTISVFTATDNKLNVNSPYVKASQSYYIMNDLSKVPGYENRPYILGWPYMRYYAEVPIHSPSGLVIGSLCVVDNKPREGLDTKGIATLREISHAVMDHLELVMSKVQRMRAERMIHGLGLFVEGSSSLRDWWMDSEKSSRTVDPNKRRMTLDERADQEFGVQGSSKVDISIVATETVEDESKGNGGFAPDNVNGSSPMLMSRLSIDPLELLSTKSESESTAMELLGSSTFREDQMTESKTNATSNDSMRKSGPESQSFRTRSASTNSSGQKQLKLRSELEILLARAANLIREAIDLSGVSFFDPPIGIGKISNYGGSPGRFKAEETRNSTAIANGHGRHNQTLANVPTEMSQSATFSTAPKEKACKVLACSTRVSSDKDILSAASFHLPERMLQCIIEKFPRGGVLEYDDKGPVSHGDLELAWYQNMPKARDFYVSGKVPQSYSSGSDGSDLAEAQFLCRMLPGVRSIILFPLWDSSRNRLVAYNMAWTTDRNRVFQREVFAYLASFCNSITSELSRLDTLAADRAKAKFISSISHELRSPLHGVLASAELLKSLSKETTSIDIINTIQTCGSTLLDTMENLLTFTKINEITVTQQQKFSANLPSWEHTEPQPLKGLIVDVDLGLLLEEVMNANISGHQFRKALDTDSSNNIRHIGVAGGLINAEDSVTVICDIDPELNWMFATQPGVWKRIVMNLLGNSLKYTAAGFIHVRLSQEEQMVASDESRKSLVCLTVEDSGKGITEEYMKYHLFTPFRQEDPLCPGTGLGLSIVHQLVASVNGTIDIQSEVGYGTKVVVKVILDAAPETKIHDCTREPYNKELHQLNARRVGLVMPDVYPNIEETPTGILSKQAKRDLIVNSSLVRAMEKRFGLETITLAALDSGLEAVDIIMTSESHFRSCQSAVSRQRTQPLIILCSKLSLDYRSVSHVNGPVLYLSQP
jgi:signal transduction histidine kinase